MKGPGGLLEAQTLASVPAWPGLYARKVPDPPTRPFRCRCGGQIAPKCDRCGKGHGHPAKFTRRHPWDVEVRWLAAQKVCGKLPQIVGVVMTRFELLLECKPTAGPRLDFDVLERQRADGTKDRSQIEAMSRAAEAGSFAGVLWECRAPLAVLGICPRCAPGAYKGKPPARRPAIARLALLVLAFAAPLAAAPHPAPLYLLATTSGSWGLGYEASQHGAELGGRIPIARQVEAWWAASWSTAPKTDGGTGEQAAFVFELDRHLAGGWWAGVGVDRVELRTPRYAKGSTGFRVHLSRRAAWGVASITARTGGGENRPRTIEAAAELAAGRFVFRLAAARVRFDSAAGRREGVRVALAVGVAIGRVSPEG